MSNKGTEYRFVVSIKLLGSLCLNPEK